ncbi:MAG TPA: transcriptional regulator, partial [Syntrophomonas sp.]|nr:transcriptional regulator [Syntrophomonas sp.]
QVEAFEREMEAFTGVKHAIGVANGSDALLLALMAVDVGPGDEVIVPAFTFFATAGAVARLGAKPVFADIDLDTFNIAADQLGALITSKTKAIIPVHLFGQMADMDPIMSIARNHNLTVIEDSAQAIGAEYRGCGSCTIGDMGCLSFYPTKNLAACGDAGMLLTNNDALADKLRVLRVHGAKKKYYHSILGFNSRLDEIQAAILRIKLRYLPQWIKARQEIAHWYDLGLERLNAERKIVVPKRINDGTHVFHQYTLRIDTRDALKQYLHENGIGSTVYYPRALHQQEVFQNYGSSMVSLPNAEKATQCVLSLPIFPELTEGLVDYVIDKINVFCGK